MRYIVRRYHKIGDVEYQPGQVLTIDDPEYAAWLGRDMRGNLELISERAPEAPPQDRMVRRPTRKRSK